jgi:hypothetical protein
MYGLQAPAITNQQLTFGAVHPRFNLLSRLASKSLHANRVLVRACAHRITLLTYIAAYGLAVTVFDLDMMFRVRSQLWE